VVDPGPERVTWRATLDQYGDVIYVEVEAWASGTGVHLQLSIGGMKYSNQGGGYRVPVFVHSFEVDGVWLRGGKLCLPHRVAAAPGQASFLLPRSEPAVTVRPPLECDARYNQCACESPFMNKRFWVRLREPSLKFSVGFTLHTVRRRVLHGESVREEEWGDREVRLFVIDHANQLHLRVVLDHGGKQYTGEQSVGYEGCNLLEAMMRENHPEFALTLREGRDLMDLTWSGH
jgi:hypothetical protein